MVWYDVVTHRKNLLKCTFMTSTLLTLTYRTQSKPISNNPHYNLMKKRSLARSEASSSQQIAYEIPQTNQTGGPIIMPNLRTVPSRRKICYRVQCDIRWSFRNVKHRGCTPRKALFPFLLSTVGILNAILTAGEHHEFNHLTRKNLGDDFVDVNNITLSEDDKRRYNFCGSRLVRGLRFFFPVQHPREKQCLLSWQHFSFFPF